MSRRRTEAFSVLTVLAVPVGLALVFPFDALVPAEWTPRAKSDPSAAFVRLTDDQQSVALRTAKVSWQNDGTRSRGQRPDVMSEVMPDEPLSADIDIDVAPPRSEMSAVPYEMSAPPHSLAAPPPRRIAPAAAATGKRPPAFSREELLELK